MAAGATMQNIAQGSLRRLGKAGEAEGRGSKGCLGLGARDTDWHGRAGLQGRRVLVSGHLERPLA